MSLGYVSDLCAQLHAELNEVRVITVVYKTEQLNAVLRFLQISVRWTASSGLTDMDGLRNKPGALCSALQLEIDCILPQAKNGKYVLLLLTQSHLCRLIHAQ